MTTNVDALAETLGHLRTVGRIEAVDAAGVQALESMAAALDRDPSNAALWRQYRDALKDLLEADDDADSSLADALAEIRSAT